MLLGSVALAALVTASPVLAQDTDPDPTPVEDPNPDPTAAEDPDPTPVEDADSAPAEDSDAAPTEDSDPAPVRPRIRIPRRSRIPLPCRSRMSLSPRSWLRIPMPGRRSTAPRSGERLCPARSIRFTGRSIRSTARINPFYGDIGAFYGDINPFYGDIGAFWGDIGAFYGDINPFYGDINPFHGTINPFNEWAPNLALVGQYWQDFGAAWQGNESLWTNPLTGTLLVTKMNLMITQTELVWGSAVHSQTGQTAREAVLNPLFARYGINPNSAYSMRALSAEKRAQFFLDWYDSLMRFSGTDRVDHWMRTVNWTPAITQQQGSGSDTIIGLLDATPMGDPDIADNVAWAGGYGATVNGHGVGVASLMVAAHDREGVMGIAPNATVVAYNPFDASGTASWQAIRTGILSLADRDASIINMSLGVAGHTLHQQWHQDLLRPRRLCGDPGPDLRHGRRQ